MVAAITGAVDFADIVNGAGVVFGALAIAYVAFKGGTMLVGLLKR